MAQGGRNTSAAAPGRRGHVPEYTRWHLLETRCAGNPASLALGWIPKAVLTHDKAMQQHVGLILKRNKMFVRMIDVEQFAPCAVKANAVAYTYSEAANLWAVLVSGKMLQCPAQPVFFLLLLNWSRAWCKDDLY